MASIANALLAQLQTTLFTKTNQKRVGRFLPVFFVLLLAQLLNRLCTFVAKKAVKKLKYRAFCAKIQNICAFALIEKEKDMNIIPKPHKYDKLGGEFTIGSQTKLFCEVRRFLQIPHEFAICHGVELTNEA